MAKYIIDRDKLVVCQEDFTFPYEWTNPSQKAQFISEA
jgi:hypothetical protein